MSKLSAYFRPTPAGRTKEVYLENFKDEDGNPLPFVLQSISAEENEAITKSCTDRNGNFDAAAYGNKVLVACLKEPDLKSSELCQFYGVIDPASVPGRMFTPGEKATLNQAALEINDFKSEGSRLIDAKNS